MEDNKPFVADTFYSVKSNKKRFAQRRLVRYMTMEEATHLHTGKRVLILSTNAKNSGKWAEATVTSTKTWKRRSDVEINLRYGLKEFFTELFTEDHPFTNILVDVEPQYVRDIGGGEDFVLVDNDREIKEIGKNIGVRLKEYGCLFVEILEGEYGSIFGVRSNIPYLHYDVERIY